MKSPTGLPILAEDWEKTPMSVKVLVTMPWEENQMLREQVADLQKQVG